eukprot:CAMPEP_0113552586 /NCGR_PEP_ID=MMETSP0015_2-20120614/15148_1 /TAXON_ID=2838 /ORGANISM="Odontella" /LENGTH=735 /DNA_ID=CAMNT_0000453577 /DNA_START=395 /DNA_END=2602 /DNA_ORIENTATION=+ /assembly_acc=CAM_ASM_000160
MAPKQLATEEYLTGDFEPRDDPAGGGLSTPTKNHPPPVDTSPATTHVASRRRSIASPGSRQLRGEGGFLYPSLGSLESIPDENDEDWEQNSLGGSTPASQRSTPVVSNGGGSRSPRSARAANAVTGPMHRSVSSPSFPRSPSSGKKQTVPAFKVFVLLLRPRDKIFELIQVEYDPSRATIGDVLDLVPASATEPKLGNQRHIGLMRTADGTELTDLTVPASPSVFSADGATANVARGDILVAIPEGYTGSKCSQLSDKILRNPKMVRLLRRKDPLKPKRSRSSSGGSTGGSVSSAGSGRNSVDSMTSSVGSFKRRGSRRVACVPPTVMEEDGPEMEERAPQSPALSVNASSGMSVSGHSVETASVRNTSTKTGSTLPGMEAIAELLSKDSEHEKRRRQEEERARAQVEERKRAAVEAKARADAEERIRGEIERKAREKAEEERKKREEAEEQRRKEEEERSQRVRAEERKIDELARKAEAAERAWEKVCAPDGSTAGGSGASPSTPPGSPRGNVRQSSFGSPGAQGRNTSAAPYPAEIEVPFEPSSSKGGGLEMFVFGMISSAVMVAITARSINSSHPQVVMVQETAGGAVGTVSVDAPQARDSIIMQQDGSDADFRRKIAYSFALFVILQVVVVILVRSPRARRVTNRIGRKVRRKVERLRGKMGGNGGDFASPKRRSVMLSPPAGQGAPSSAGAMSRSKSRSTLAEAAQAAAKRSDYGYGSGGGANWRKAANL